jgi:hypothetical protein
MAVSRLCWQEQPALIILAVARMATHAHPPCPVAPSTAGAAAPPTTVVTDARQHMEPVRLALQVQITVAADPTDTFVLPRFHAVHAMDFVEPRVTIAQLQVVSRPMGLARLLVRHRARRLLQALRHHRQRRQ